MSKPIVFIEAVHLFHISKITQNLLFVVCTFFYILRDRLQKLGRDLGLNFEKNLSSIRPYKRPLRPGGMYIKNSADTEYWVDLFIWTVLVYQTIRPFVYQNKRPIKKVQGPTGHVGSNALVL